YKLYAANHKVIATNGGTYSSLSALKAGINSVIKNAGTAPIEDQTLINIEEQKYPKWIIFQDARGEYRFRLHASNGECVCTPNDGYLSKDACKVGMKSIANTAKHADIVKAEED
ncbi:MAG: YegP family protein, partial [Clostridia bacterium]|nr:YegP family protein [Clostridia bacterium]